ncbi:MAG: hypothetical protein HY800_09410 [Ignavibacteriales bacterium]|nr:hypothetical protein [Ignavibacteriales bacterium]
MEPAIQQQQETIAQFIDRINESTSLEVLERIKSESRITRIKIVTQVLKALYHSFIFRKEYKKGIYGFITARLEAIAVLIQYSKVWEYQMRSNDGTGFMPPTSIEEVHKIKQRYTNP